MSRGRSAVRGTQHLQPAFSWLLTSVLAEVLASSTVLYVLSYPSVPLCMHMSMWLKCGRVGAGGARWPVAGRVLPCYGCVYRAGGVVVVYHVYRTAYGVRLRAAP